MNKSIHILVSLSVLVFSQFASAASSKPVDLTLASGDILRVEPVAAAIIRIRLSADGRFEPSLMERYGIVRTAWPECEVSIGEQSGVTRVTTGGGTLEVRAADGRMRLLDGRGQVICEQILPQLSHLSGPQLEIFRTRQEALAEYFKGEKRKAGQVQIVGSAAQDKTEYSESMHPFDLPDNSFGATFRIRDDERFYGLGTASSHRLQLRGHGYRLWTQYRGNFDYRETPESWEQTEGPIPLLFSTGGWGVFVNTTWVHYYDVGRYESDKMFFWGPGGQLDFYLLIGDTPARLIELYTEITGKPRLLPLFGYGLSYVGQITQNEHELLNDARLFREKGIPCDLMGLEPQWMKVHYDSSHEKEWNPDKFYMPAWMGPDSKSSTFIGGLERIGFKLSLWLVCRDDLTMEEERQIAIREGRGADFPAEPEAWFAHLQKFVRNGVRAFKMDPENLIQEHAGREYY
ncbi:MAG: TIM-barrel domain-containing protein, partial [Phycisphaerales bacterium]